MADEYEHLKAAHTAGAWIYGIEPDGKLHRIENPSWSCPPDRYIALMPFLSPRQQVAPVAWIAPSSLESLRGCRKDEHNGFVEVWMREDDERTIPLYTTTGQTSDARDAQDAARYRWLREPAYGRAHLVKDWCESELDRVIDAAMRQEAE